MSNVAEQPKQGAKCKCVEMEDGRWKASGWAQVGELYLEDEAIAETREGALSDLFFNLMDASRRAVNKLRASINEATGAGV